MLSTPDLTPSGSFESADSSSSSHSTGPGAPNPHLEINPLYSQLHPADPERPHVLVVSEDSSSNPIKQQLEPAKDDPAMFATPPLGRGAFLEEVRSPSTLTITPKTRQNDETQDGATSTTVSHDERDHVRTKLHQIKLDAKDKLHKLVASPGNGDGHGEERESDPAQVADQSVTDRLDRPLGLGFEESSSETEGEYLSGDDTETENDATTRTTRREGGGALTRVETFDSQTTGYTSTNGGGGSFYSAESDLDSDAGGGANSTRESFEPPRRSESPVSFTVDGTSPPRLQSNGIDQRYPVAYAPGYVPTNSRLVPAPSSPTRPTQSSSPKLSSSPRLSIPLPYVSSSSPSPTPAPASASSNRLVPTASVVKPHPTLAHLSSSPQQPRSSPPTAATGGSHVPPARRASTTSSTLHPPPPTSSATFVSRRGSSASTSLRPNSNSFSPSAAGAGGSPSGSVASSSFPPRSLSASQLTPSSSAATISQNLGLPIPTHSSTYPPLPQSSPSTTPAQSPSLSRGGGVPSIHDDVESSIAAQAEQIRRQRYEKRQAAEAAERRLNERGGPEGAINAPGAASKEKGKGRDIDPDLTSTTTSGAPSAGQGKTNLRRNSAQSQSTSQQRHLSTSSSTMSNGRLRSGSSQGLGLGAMIGYGDQLQQGGGGSSALSTTSLVPLPLSQTTSSSLAPPPVGLGQHGSPGSQSAASAAAVSGVLHARSASGGTGSRRSVSGESARTSLSIPPAAPQGQQAAPASSTSTSSTATLAAPPPLAPPPSQSGGASLSIRPSSSSIGGGLLQRSPSQALTTTTTQHQHGASPFDHNREKAGGGDEKDEGAGGVGGVPLVGNLIGTDHENYVLMYNMLTGIRIGVSRCQAKAARPLTDADYTARHKFSFDIVGNELTPSVRYDFKFKDYAPWVFRELREYFFLDPSDYLISLTAKYILSELGSPGKSGSFFYFSRDYRFIIKTIRHAEHKFLRKILKEYHEHVKRNPHTLLSRFYGLHRVKLPHGRKIHFVIMNNLFPPHRDIHETYDLKGSSVGRLYPEAKAAQNPHAVLKDLNWLGRNRQLELGPEKKALFEEQLRRDTELMQKLGIMDYSLLTGVHMTNKGNEERLREGKLSVFQPDAPRPTRKPTQVHRSADASALRAAVQRSDPQSITSGQDLPEHDTSTERRRFLFYQDEGGMRATGEANEELGVIYYLGIIDILTPYTLVKRFEHFFKGIKNDKHCISAVPPKEYGDRFLSFIRSCIRGNPQSLRPKMWMPPISEEDAVDEQLQAAMRDGTAVYDREKVAAAEGKEKVQ